MPQKTEKILRVTVSFCDGTNLVIPTNKIYLFLSFNKINQKIDGTYWSVSSHDEQLSKMTGS